MFGLALLLGFTAIVWLIVVSKREDEIPEGLEVVYIDGEPLLVPSVGGPVWQEHCVEPIDFTDWSDWEWEDAA